MVNIIINIWILTAIIIASVIIKKRAISNQELTSQDGFDHMLDWIVAPILLILFIIIGIYAGQFKKAMIELYKLLFLIPNKTKTK